MIRANHLAIPEDELFFSYVRSSGPGGQHVNKVSTAVQLRFDAENSPSLPREVKNRLLSLAGSRATKQGEVVIEAGRFASQKKNREDALARLEQLLRQAARRPRPRKKTRPSRAAKRRRLEEKRKQSQKKSLRKSPIL
ncbi:MAG: aminoacyl-tRNA hydrolase [Deltaproteobacteria bacterium]|nr:aminoacyl-tRNA hydrolase [Deltaproteobacteria bacterium]